MRISTRTRLISRDTPQGNSIGYRNFLGHLHYSSVRQTLKIFCGFEANIFGSLLISVWWFSEPCSPPMSHLHFIQKVVQYCEEENGQGWNDAKADRLFGRVWVKVSGDHDSLPRRNVVVEEAKNRFSPGHIVRPGVIIYFGRMSCGGFIKFVGWSHKLVTFVDLLITDFQVFCQF